MAEAKEIVGARPTCVSGDIGFIDPAFAPGTGTPEVGGPNAWQALKVARLFDRVGIVAADLVEVSPPFDQSGATACPGVSVKFGILCHLSGLASP